LFLIALILILAGGIIWAVILNIENTKQTERPVEQPTPIKTDLILTRENYPKIDCATAMYPLALETTKAALKINNDEDAKKLVICSKTPEAYKNLINGNVDIILLFGPSEDEVQMARDKGFELEKKAIGRDAFVFVNNKANPVRTLTQEQIKQIYEGKITNWKQVGGGNSSIIAYQRPKNSGSQTLMEKFMGNRILAAPPMNQVPELMGQLIDVVADYNNAQNSIGYSVFYYASEMYKNSNISFLAVDGISPNRETIKNKTYPITEDVYAVIRSTEKRNSPARQLIQFLLTDEGQKAVEKGGYVSIK
jgi:phosphate transport system substrate-binding protein